MNNDVSMLNYFLKMYDSCFADSIPDELPPLRGVHNCRIDLIQGSSSPNKAPYHILLAQQEEIMSQVNEL